MLDSGQRPLWSDRSQSALDSQAPELGRRAERQSSDARGFLLSAAQSLRGALAQPRLVVGLALIAAGLVWAIARGLQFYGLTPVPIAYDVDQPPLLLVLVGAWLLYRSRPR
jgi:hypothetical protein